jgi:hypothetical protein
VHGQPGNGRLALDGRGGATPLAHDATPAPAVVALSGSSDADIVGAHGAQRALPQAWDSGFGVSLEQGGPTILPDGAWDARPSLLLDGGEPLGLAPIPLEGGMAGVPGTSAMGSAVELAQGVPLELGVSDAYAHQRAEGPRISEASFASVGSFGGTANAGPGAGELPSLELLDERDNRAAWGDVGDGGDVSLPARGAEKTKNAERGRPPAAQPSSAPSSTTPPAEASGGGKARSALVWGANVAQAAWFLFAMGAAIVVNLPGGAFSNGNASAQASAITDNDVALEDIAVTRRKTDFGLDIVIVTGQARNLSSTPLAGVQVEAVFGPKRVRGIARGLPDPFQVASAARAEDVDQLRLTVPPDTTVAANERVPFAIVAVAPPDGTTITLEARGSRSRS